MPGLLEILGASTGDPNKDSAINQGILQAGLALLNSKGNTANALGQAGMAGIQGYQQAQQMNWQQQQQSQQMKQWEEQNRQTERKKQIEGLAPKFYKPASNGTAAVVQQTGGLAPTMANAQIQQANATPGGFDWNGYIQAVEAVDPVQALQLRQMTAKQEKDPIKLGQGETLIDPKTLKPVYQSAAKPDPTPSAIKEYEYAKGQGYGGTFEQFQISQKKAGASNVSVNTGQKGYENESKLRNDFKSEPIYKDFQDMKSAHAQIKTALTQGTPIADTAAATKIMKLLDPGSVVRESELGMAMAASGKMDRMTNYVQMQMSGQKLTPQQRIDFGKLADELYDAAGQAYNAKRGEYEQFGKTYDLNPAVLGEPAKAPQKSAPTSVGGWSITPR